MTAVLAQRCPRSGDRVVERHRAAEMPPALWAAWEATLDRAPLLRSPFLAPGWTRLIAGCRPDVFVGVLWRGGEPVAFLPFQEDDPGRAGPVGGVFNDCQAVVVAPGTAWTPDDWLDGLGLESLRFEGHLASQTQMRACAARTLCGHAIDMTRPFEDYRAWLAASRRRLLPELDRKTRAAERTLGPLRLEAHRVDPALLDHALRLKADQWARSDWPGRFFVPWEHQMMHALLTWQELRFAGLFSVLWAGETPLAYHLGMRGLRVWHCWTIVHEPAHARFSPGLLIHLAMVRAGPDLGLDEFDMGLGSYGHKLRLETHRIPLLSGRAERRKDDGP